MLIKTDRLYLREMNIDDFDSLFAVLADSDIMMHYPYTFDKERVIGWINKNIERYHTFGFGLWAVCLKDSGVMIGDCGLTMQNINGTIKPEIGYHIRKDKQRQGYGKEAAIAVRDWTFKNTPFKMIYSYMKHTNMPSIECAKSWGCEFIEQYYDDNNQITKVYGLSKDRWLSLYTKNNLFENVDCIHLKVDDIDKGIDFYCNNLKLNILWRSKHACGLGCDNDITEIVLNDDLDFSIDFKVENVLEAVKVYQKAGGKVEYGPFDIDIGKCVLVSDLWNNKYCLLDMSKGSYDVDETANIKGVSKK